MDDVYYVTSGRIIVRACDDMPVCVVTGRPWRNTESNELATLIMRLLNAHANGEITLGDEMGR